MQEPTDAEAAATLEQAIEKAKEVAADIRQAADDLAVANTVLESHLAEEGRDPEVDMALDHTDAVEKTLTRSADTLDEVNATLGSVAAPTPKR
jgi:flagellar biosynthesis/type III secretory pathway ATPase